MLDDLAKPNLLAVFGLALASAALPRIAPEFRPALKTAIKFGITLFAESEGEAEAELVQSLVEATIDAIRDELAKPADAAERTAAVRQQISRFRHRARRRSRRWDGDAAGNGRVYRRHVGRLAAALADQEQRSLDKDRPIVAEAAAQLVQD
jgi:hypothetical protein